MSFPFYIIGVTSFIVGKHPFAADPMQILLPPMILFLAVAAYLLLSPVPIEPVSWHAPASPGFTGAYAANTGLAGAAHIDLGSNVGPENVVLGLTANCTWAWPAAISCAWRKTAARARSSPTRAGGRSASRSMAAVLRVPRALWPAPPAHGHVLAFTEDGTVVASLQDPSGRSPSTTGATETAAGLFIQNVNDTRLGWLPRYEMRR